VPAIGSGRRAAAVTRVAVALLSAAAICAGSAASVAASRPLAALAAPKVDVVVYAATPGGILAAVTAARAGARVALVEPSGHVGGMISNGLTFTDIGDQTTLGGYTKEFFDRVQQLEGTTWGRFHFEPHVAEQAFSQMLASARVSVFLNQPLAPGGVAKTGTRITSISSTEGLTFTGSVFIDASYEGDLLAAAGVSYRVGREATAEYGESLAGVRPTRVIMSLPAGVSPGATTPPPGPLGSADARIQEANYRLCFSSSSANRVPFSPPAGYDADDYAVVASYLAQRQASTGQTAQLSWVLTVSNVANQKFDVNAGGPLSLAMPGTDWAWPEGDAATRAGIAAQHAAWSKGLLYFLRNDLGVPASVRIQLAQYGLCKDEFTDNGNWPRMLYVREARRMVGSYVMTQRDIQTDRSKPDIIGVGSYRVDSHDVSRWVDANGRLLAEGTLSLPYRNYAIPYRSIVPLESELTNLLAPVAMSASHVAHASLRMEPHYMLTGEAAGQAAALVVRGARKAVVVQEVDIGRLQAELRAHGSFLHNLGSRG
jgi:hypothetical protein